MDDRHRDRMIAIRGTASWFYLTVFVVCHVAAAVQPHIVFILADDLVSCQSFRSFAIISFMYRVVQVSIKETFSRCSMRIKWEKNEKKETTSMNRIT